MTHIEHEGFEYPVEQITIDEYPPGDPYVWYDLTDQSPVDALVRYIDRFGILPERFYYLTRPRASWLICGPVRALVPA